MIRISFPNEKKIRFKDYEKFILPSLRNKELGSVIFYRPSILSVFITAHIEGFIIVTEVPNSFIIEKYKDKLIPDELGAISNTIDEDHKILSLFNADYMDGRGILEVR